MHANGWSAVSVGPGVRRDDGKGAHGISECVREDRGRKLIGKVVVPAIMLSRLRGRTHILTIM